MKSQKFDADARRVNMFAFAYPDVARWLRENKDSSDFADSLLTYVKRNGTLTERQFAAVNSAIAKRAKSSVASAKAERFETAQLYAAIASSRAKGAKAPKIRTVLFIDEIFPCEVEFKAKAFEEAVHVKVNGDYQGTLVGEALAGRQVTCGSFQVDAIKEALLNLESASIAYGRHTGQCSCCGRVLNNPESIALGIGPVCREKFFA